MIYRKRPLFVEAIEVAVALRLNASNWAELPEWLRDPGDSNRLALKTTVYFERDAISFTTPNSAALMQAKRGDWIVRGSRGEMYPVSAEDFAATFERA